MSFDPPPWLEFTTRAPSAQGDAGEASGQDPDVRAVVDREGSRSTWRGGERVAHEGRVRREGHGSLGDEVARGAPKGGLAQGRAASVLVGLGPDDDPLAARNRRPA